MRQDKLLELRGTQFRWNPLPWLASRHLEHQSNGILAVRSYLRKPFPAAVRSQIPALKRPATSCQVLDLTDLDGRFALGIYRVQRGQIGAAFVDGHRLGRTILSDRLFKEAARCHRVALGSEQEINGFTRAVSACSQSNRSTTEWRAYFGASMDAPRVVQHRGEQGISKTLQCLYRPVDTPILLAADATVEDDLHSRVRSYFQDVHDSPPFKFRLGRSS
jgi:hypothetical protein